MDFSIIIINFNLSNEVKNCIDSLLKVFKNPNYEIILIDNNSEDRSIDKIADNFKETLAERFTFLISEKNIGFGNACNLATQKSVGNVLFFLNPDTVINEDFLEKIKNELEDPKYPIGIIGLNVSKSRLFDYSAGYFPNLFIEVLNIVSIGRFVEAFYVRMKTQFVNRKRVKVDWVMGAAFFIKRELFNSVNGFDHDYFLYFEEMDLCKRIKNKGFSIIYFPRININHIGSLSTKKNYYFFTKMFYKGKILFLKKHSSKLFFNIYTFLLRLHFINQIFLWWVLKILVKGKSLGKIKAFRELLNTVKNPEIISNHS